MSVTASSPPGPDVASVRLPARTVGVVDRLTARALAATLDPASEPEAVADELVQVADGNRAAVHRALRRLELRLVPVDDGPDRRSAAHWAAEYLRLALRRGTWRW